MAWHYIEYSCGHPGRVQIVGPMADRPRKAEWAARDECEDCIAAGRKRASEEAAKYAMDHNWPTLTGTKRQIAWAESIRRSTINEYRPNPPALGEAWHIKHPEAWKMVEDVLAKASRPEASWWIDHQRDRNPLGVNSGELRRRAEFLIDNEYKAYITVAPLRFTGEDGEYAETMFFLNDVSTS